MNTYDMLYCPEGAKPAPAGRTIAESSFAARQEVAKQLGVSYLTLAAIRVWEPTK